MQHMMVEPDKLILPTVSPTTGIDARYQLIHPLPVKPYHVTYKPNVIGKLLSSTDASVRNLILGGMDDFNVDLYVCFLLY